MSSKISGACRAVEDAPLQAVNIIGERVPCREAKQRIWQALDLLGQQSRRLRTSSNQAAEASTPVPARRAESDL